jgi:glycerol-3-phosphate dehydrogenase
MNIKAEVLIVGGGATGVGILRDLSLRSISSVLVEKGDFASGASGRNHGLLHSGARYVTSDLRAARECIVENRILKRIAPHCLEETKGLFISLPGDDRDFQTQFLRACEEAEIPTVVLSRDEALDLEPELNPDLLGAVEVPDGAFDPFSLILVNAADAEKHGGRIFRHTEVLSLILDGDRVKGIRARDQLHGEEFSVDASYIINATGGWTNEFLKLAGLHIGMALSKGSLLVTNRRLSQRVINRCRPPSDGDIIVPNDTVSVLGTTSVRSGHPMNFEVTPSEVSLLISETSRMIPAIRETRLIRAYAGIRPLLQSEEKGDDRQISRGFALIDHGERDGIKNLITVTGGKWVTYRLMAEKASDLVCEKMGREASCATHLNVLPGRAGHLRLQDRLHKIGGEVLCDCEMIRRAEVEQSLNEEKVEYFHDILHRTRLAKGTCQGGFCSYRLLGLLCELERIEGNSDELLKSFLEERWRGIRPVLWGTSLREAELIEGIYKGIFNL